MRVMVNIKHQGEVKGQGAPLGGLLDLRCCCCCCCCTRLRWGLRGGEIDRKTGINRIRRGL